MQIYLVVYLLLDVAHGTIIIPYSDASKCLVGQYFQYSSLRCIDCGSNQKPVTSKLSCVCNNGFKFTLNNGGPDINCQSCGTDEVSSSDAWDCVKCASDSLFNAAMKTCADCANGQIKVDKAEDGSLLPRQRCVPCVSQSQPGISQRVCKSCSQSTLLATASLASGRSCSCPVGITESKTFVEENGVCLSSADYTILVVQSYRMEYPSGQIISRSGYFVEHLIASQALCKTNQNFTACQLLGNLCVMFMYSETNYEITASLPTDACKEYLQIVKSFSGDFVGRLTDWPVSMPWLYYQASKPVEVLDKTDISTSFTRGATVSFVLVQYAANGTFLGLTSDASIMEVCPVPADVSYKAFVFTSSYKSECKITLQHLLQTRQTLFYDLFIRVNNDNDLYPVSVLVQNIKYKGSFVNKQSDRSRWRLTRRFFIVDSVSGREDDLSTPVTVVQYASSIELSYRLRDNGLIYPPLLKINYASAVVDAKANTKQLGVSLKVTYEMNTQNIERNIEIATGVFSVLAVIYAFIRIVSWRRRQGTIMLDGSSLIMFIIFVCSTLALAFCVVLVGACLIWLIFFKAQTTVIFLAPIGGQLTLMKGLFFTAFVMKLFDVLYILYHQIYVDIFFIDWERPRGAINLNTDGQNKNISIPVSIMRTLFVANEWQEIQTCRRIKPTLQILLVLFFLKVAKIESWSSLDPNHSAGSDDEYNFCLRLAVIAVLYLVIGFIQWLVFGLMYERFMGDSIGDFVDFCSMSNISVFVMSHNQFGYYMHGRSVHGRSDTSLHELYEQFQREEDNLCGKRGLEANTDLQTFEVAFTVKFRNEYVKILQPLLARDIQGRRGQIPARQNPGLPGSSLTPALERSVHAYNTMNHFLSSFIEHAIRDNDYAVRDKFLMERLLQNELEAPVDKSVFYNDEGQAFTDLLLYGHEWSLLLFNMLFFILIDWISSWNAVLAAVCSYFLDILIVSVRASLGKKNLAKKTLVNERFLI